MSCAASQQPRKSGNVPILEMRELRLREMQGLASGHSPGTQATVLSLPSTTAQMGPGGRSPTRGPRPPQQGRVTGLQGQDSSPRTPELCFCVPIPHFTIPSFVTAEANPLQESPLPPSTAGLANEAAFVLDGGQWR